MCGIVGAAGVDHAVDILIEGLKRLEYRGYDSAGVAVHDGSRIAQRRAVGKLDQLIRVVETDAPRGRVGIGHTRWATHGAVTETNAHPHRHGRVTLVHNGIVENHRILKTRLIDDGAAFASETDSEVLAAWLDRALDRRPDDLWAAMDEALRDVEGAFAFGALIEDHPDVILAARRGCPLALGEGDGARFLGSDALALAPFARRIVFLEEGDRAILSADRFDIRDAANRPAERAVRPLSLSPALAEKGEYRHFMEKEIHEQPEAIARTLSAYIDADAGTLRKSGVNFRALNGVSLVACGTAAYAAQIGALQLESWARLPARVDAASEYRYRAPVIAADTMCLAVSQSGETADTLAALRLAASEGAMAAALVNVETSTMAREAALFLPIHAGPEIGVASTKAFTCQLAALSALALMAARDRETMDPGALEEAVAALMAAPRQVADALKCEPQVEALAHDIARARDVLFIGRGVCFPLALEGALKLKEISYIHAEGYAAGELKHGPIALVDENTPIIALAPRDEVFAKTLSNAEEAAARGGKVVLISDAKGLVAAGDGFWRRLEIPSASGPATPIVTAAPLQMLAYHVAVAKGTDVDRPRNLAKSVTVE